ncbi:MAG: X-Pro dipeptidyl-peptidase [Glaciecola sp.]|jgi:X-Pro dipeptidyl-peptidase
MSRTLVAFAVVAGTAAAGATIPAAAQDPDYETVAGLSEPTYGEQIIEPYRIATDHGTIYGEVMRPVVPEGTLVPIILTYSPYNHLGSPTNQTGSIADDSTASYYVPRGYARAVFDLVGTRESGGCYDYGGIGERETAATIIEVLATQPWASGKLGMVGGSYDGTTQIAAAIEAPEHLTTIVPQVAIDRWYDYAFGGGIRYYLNEENPSDEGFDTPLAFDFGFGFIPPTDVSDPETYSEAFETRVNPCERVEHTQRAYDPDPVYDDFWDERDYRKDASNVTASVFLEGAWLDHNVKHWNSTRFFEALPDDLPKKLVMGQWTHSANRFPDATSIRHAWFDYWLLDLPTGIMRLPAVDTQVQTGERIQDLSWPPPGMLVAEVPLASSSGEESPTTLVQRTGAAPSWSDVNKQLTETQVFGEGCLTECITFTTGPVEADVRISGAPTLELTVTTSGTETHFTPVLYDEAADGSTEIITRGFLNARNRNGLRVSEAVTPGAEYQASVEFWDVDWIVLEGHRIGVAMMSTNSVWALSDASAATNTLTLDGASTLRLPVSRGQESLGLTINEAEPAAEPETAPASPETTPSSAPLPVTGGGLAAMLLGLGAISGARRLRRR